MGMFNMDPTPRGQLGKRHLALALVCVTTAICAKRDDKQAGAFEKPNTAPTTALSTNTLPKVPNAQK